tara:strand:- start:736 stop:1170 length:435 start_codon:yes stop_codon:yes gene_type:complete
MNLAVALVLALPSPWPPRFESKHLTNQTLQRAYASHPPLRAWVRAVLAHRRPTWDSVDSLLDEYVTITRHALFVQDVDSIQLEEDLRYKVDRRDKEVARQGLDPKADPRHKNWDTDEIIRDRMTLKAYEDLRAATDRSGGAFEI